MPRTPIAPELIHRAEDLARDASRLGALREDLARHARPWVRAGLQRDARSADAGAWLDDASALLGSPSRGLTGPANDALRAELQGSLGDPAVAPEESEVDALARDLADAVARAWVSCLDEALGDESRVALDATMGPLGAARSLADVLAEATEPYGLTRGEAIGLLGALREDYARGGGTRLLPLGIALTTERGGRVVAVREPDGAGERKDVIESGEQLREGAVSPGEAAHKQGRTKR